MPDTADGGSAIITPQVSLTTGRGIVVTGGIQRKRITEELRTNIILAAERSGYKRGYQPKLADEFGISQAAISKIIKAYKQSKA